MSKINLFIIVSILSLFALVIFQISWYKHSQSILEEQFDSTVNMAMGLAVQNASKDSLASCVEPSQAKVTSDNVFTGISEENIDLNKLDTALAAGLAFYNIDLDYEFHVINEIPLAQCVTSYSCKLTPFSKTQNLSIQVFFKDKSSYLRDKMKFQLFACLLIILLISGVFIFANKLLKQQKQIAQNNIDFFNNMAHEFNTPLTNIGLASKLFSTNNSVTKNDRFLGIIQNESSKLKQQVERFLQLMQIEAGSFQLQLEHINLSELLQEVVADMQLQMTEHNGHLKLHQQKETIFIKADKFHLSNAFRNLIDNAIKYALAQPKIDIYVNKNDTDVSILFEDAGVGIPANQHKYVFKKFHRISTGNLHQQKGFGLGLAYVKSIIEAHKGAIRLCDQMKNGSRFNLILPAYYDE